MARINKPATTTKHMKTTHEGAPAKRISVEAQLERSVLSCLLWESTFYEGGLPIAGRIADLVAQVPAEFASELAIKARSEYRLRHAPLLIAREMARHHNKKIVSETIAGVIQRADELSEFLAIYWKDREPGSRERESLSKQVKLGLAMAFPRFDAYQLSKYNRSGQAKLRDVMFLVHPKPKDKEQAAVWQKLAANELESPDTWEVSLSAGKDKKETFTRLLKEGKLGYMALLRNLRNMKEAEINESLVFDALRKGAEKSKALPFRYIAAARAVPAWEPALDEAMQLALRSMETLKGKTIILVDISTSMNQRLSARSDLTRTEAACALAILVAGISEDYEVWSFSDNVVQVAPRKGMALSDAILTSQHRYATYLGKAVKEVNKHPYDRLIVITDEQTWDAVPGARRRDSGGMCDVRPGGLDDPMGLGYMINVCTYENGVGYGPSWVHIDGFSEAVIRYIQELEKTQLG